MPNRKRSGVGSGRTRIFADPKPETVKTFQLDTGGLSPAEEEQLQAVPRPRLVESRMALADVVGGKAVEEIERAKKISFHAVGDTGDVNSRTAPDQAAVIESMIGDIDKGKPAPSFFFHLGDVVYFFGERDKYYEQFYSPFRAYDRAIFAITGNHDMVVSGHGEHSTEPSLAGFLANFCAEAPGPAPDAAGVQRDAMDQPGAYFTLDAPFVSIIGLCTNTLEGPGIISPKGLAGTEAVEKVGTHQLEFLKSELERLRAQREKKERAVIIACHHPPISTDETHGGGASLMSDLDEAYEATGLIPDAVLSGHAHLYEHWEHTIGKRSVPYLIAGSGGYGLGHASSKKAQVPGFTMKGKPISAYGYLLLTVDMSVKTPELTIAFKQMTPAGKGETLRVPLT
jgi:Calcineurin-like phosphoesterase